MDSFIKVKGSSDFVRDKNTGAIININTKDMTASRYKKEAWKKQNEEFETLKNDVNDIKILLTKMVEKYGSNNS